MKRQEGTRLKLFHVRLDESLIDQLKLKAVKEHTTVQALMNEAVASLLKRPREEGQR